MREVAVSIMTTNVRHLIGLDSFLTNEQSAVERSLNRFGKLAWERAQWPFCSALEQVIPDVRVRSIDVNDAGSGYSSAPAVTISGGSGSGATASATIDGDGKVNGISVTAQGTGYVDEPDVSIAGTATATANLLAYVDFGTTIADVFSITTADPYGNTNPREIPFRITFESGGSEYGLAALEGRSSTAPVWVHYRKPWPDYASAATDFPYVFSEYATYGAFSDWLIADGQTSRGQVALEQAEAILLTELDKLERQQRQQTPVRITTYVSSTPSPA